MKKLISVILAVCLAMLSAITFTACSELEDPQGPEMYYAYDAVTEEYNEKDCLEFNGNKCKQIANISGVQMTVDGTVEYDGSKIIVRCTLGEDDNTVDIVMYGEKEAAGVLRFYRQEVTSSGKTSTQNTVEYYCKKGCAPKKQQPGESDGVYYEYDPSTKQHDKSSTVIINGSACKFSAIFEGDLSIDANGTAEFTGSSFIFDCTGLGVRMVYMGVKEKDGVLRVDSVTTTIDDYTDLDTTVTYFCKDGVKPDNPITSEPNDPSYYTITLDFNGGTYYSESATRRLTDSEGKIYLPFNDPTRDGYVFVGYNTKKDGTGTAVDEDTVFTKDMTVYAVWVAEVTVTFRNNNLNIAKKKVGKGQPLGDFTVPGLEGNYQNDYSFKGWYNGNKQYVSSTTVENDITLTAAWYTQAEINSYINSLPSSTKPGHIYIHYWRFDHDHSEEGTKTTASAPLYSSPINSKSYKDWLLWACPDAGYREGNGRYFYPMKIDMSGAVYDIDYTYIYHDAGDDADLDTYYGDGELWVALCAGKNHDKYSATDGGSKYLSDFRDDYFAYDHVFFIQDYTYRKVYYNSKTGKFR